MKRIILFIILIVYSVHFYASKKSIVTQLYREEDLFDLDIKNEESSNTCVSNNLATLITLGKEQQCYFDEQDFEGRYSLSESEEKDFSSNRCNYKECMKADPRFVISCQNNRDSEMDVEAFFTVGTMHNQVYSHNIKRLTRYFSCFIVDKKVYVGTENN